VPRLRPALLALALLLLTASPASAADPLTAAPADPLAAPADPLAAPADPLLAPEATCPGAEDASLPVEAQEAAMLCLLDHARRQSGVPPLAVHAALIDSAGRKAGDIVGCAAYSHAACGLPFDHHIRASGYWTGCGTLGENIAWDSGRFGTARAILASWLGSEGHRRALLSAGFADQGIGLAQGAAPGDQVWVHHLGARC